MLRTLTPLLMLFLLIVSARFVRAEEKKKEDLFQPKSVWTGVETNDERKAKRVEHKARLKVTERDGEKFVAEYHVKTPTGDHGLKLEGRLHDGQIEARATKILSGTWAVALEVAWQGEVRGDELALVRQDEKHLTITTKLSLEKQKSGK